jgi:hypothetical protein
MFGGKVGRHLNLPAYALPPFHSDPFDRLLIAQSQLDGIPLLTGDDEIRRYDLKIIWQPSPVSQVDILRRRGGIIAPLDLFMRKASVEAKCRP